jgi:signal transduction histidine kinase
MRSAARAHADSLTSRAQGHATLGLPSLRRHSKTGASGFKSNPLIDTFLNNLGIGLVLFDNSGRITLVNQAARRLAQKKPEGELLSASPRIWGTMFDVNGLEVPAAEWPWMRALQGTADLGTEYHLVHPNGDYPVLFGAQPTLRHHSQIIGGIGFLINITELSSRHLLMREDAVLNERSRLADEIHDTLIQGFYAILLQLEVADKELSENFEQGRHKLRRLRELAKHDLTEARRAIWALSSETFGSEDPAVIFELLAHRLFEGTGIAQRLDIEKSAIRYAPDIRHEILRIGKEAMLNVLRHAEATLVRIELAYGDRQVRLSVVDNGRGFEPALLSSDRKGFGLYASRIRAERIGGSLVIQTAPGKGTRLVATMPLCSSRPIVEVS